MTKIIKLLPSQENKGLEEQIGSKQGAHMDLEKGVNKCEK